MAKLSRLTLQNYRNIPEITINFEGRDGRIVGLNRIGKTNCIEAICYLLTDKLLGGSSDIPSIKRHGAEREKVVVEGVLYTDEGEITLRKEFYEKWVRPRGSATEELQGHSTDYYVNGAKQARAKDFFDALQEKLGIPSDFSGMDAYQLVIDPFYLGEGVCGSKDWKMARKAIIGIVGDVTPEEIYQRNADAGIAREDLIRHQYDDGEAKKAIRGEIDGYKKKMASNESLIEEYRRAAESCEATDEEAESARAQCESIDEQIAKLRLGSESPYAEEVTSLQSELYDLQQEYGKSATAVVDRSESESLRKKIAAKQEEISALNLQRQSVQFDISKLAGEIKERTDRQNGHKARLQELKSDYESVSVDGVCPTCGQPLPPERIEEASNRKKAEILAEYERIKNLALDNRKEIQALSERLQALRERDFDGEGSRLSLEYTDLCKKLNDALAREQSSAPKPDPRIKARIEQINERLSEISALQSEGSKGSGEQIAALKAKKSELLELISKKVAADNSLKRMAEIRAESVGLGKKQASAEQRLWAVGEFVRTKLQLLDEHMASKLGEVRFQLIKENIKAGSYDEVCVPYIISPITGKHTDTLFPDGSKSEQIYTGIQIIKAIRDSKGWSPLPIIFDQGGELDSASSQKIAYDAEAQIIAVKVEGESKKPTFIPFN